MRFISAIVSVLAIVAFVGSAEQATADPAGEVILVGGANQTDPHATKNGAIWMDTGSGPQIMQQSDNDITDINFEVLGGTTPSNLQLLCNPSFNTAFTTIWLLSNPDPAGNGNVPNSASWDMNMGANGQWMPLSPLAVLVPGSAGPAYFELFGWTGPYNTYQAALAEARMSTLRASFWAARTRAQLIRFPI